MRRSSFTIYNASAGSGKTFTLVKEYLVLLFRGKRRDAYKQILAVTFTNKAVAEMKSRIIDSLFAFSKEVCPKKYLSLRDLVAAETGLDEAQVRLKATAILKNIIHNYAAFEVSTIDGFTHRVLRTFAKDLGLPLNFEVELNSSEVLQEAVDRLLSRAGEDKRLTEVLISFALGKTDEDKSWDIAKDLYAIAELLTRETNQPFLQLLKNKKLEDFEKLSENLKQQLLQLEKATVQVATEFHNLLEDNSLEQGDFSGGHCPKFFEKLINSNFSVGFDAAWQVKLAESCLYPKRVDEHKKQLLDQLQPEIVRLFEEAKQKIGEMEFLKAVQKNLTPLSLLSAIQDEIEAIKQERSIVLISDFNATIAKAVKNQPAPFIYERLGERYRNYFIDEFQDTSQLQWENLIPLIDHALTSQDESNELGSLTLVGDAKQSIYRWRGGKAEQFMDLCREKNPFNLENKEVVVLPKNYRSTKTIVDFNNDFFQFNADCFSDEAHQHLFKHTSFQDPASQNGGYVNLRFVEAENAEEELQVYPEEVLRIIRDLEARGISKSEICILTRTGREGVAIANFLSEEGIPIISYQSLLVSRAPEVRFLTAVLRFAIEGRDKKLKLQILEFLLDQHLGNENSYEFISQRIRLENQAFFDSLQQSGFRFDMNKVNGYSLYEAVEYIIRSFQVVTTSNAYVQFFLDFVYEVSQKDSAGLFGFLELWDQKKDILSIVAPRSEDAVQILTIHKAKGLEFPIVIYPFANGSIQDVARESLWLSLPEPISQHLPVGYMNASQKMLNWGGEAAALYHELCCYSQLDALNVMYVALTRPVQQLYVISKMELDKKGNENPNRISGLLIAFLKARGLWDGSSSYDFGSADNFIPEAREETNSVQQQHFFSTPTEGQGISIVTRAGSLWDSKQERAIEKGQLIHDLFARITRREDVERVLTEARARGLFKKEEEVQLRTSIYSVIDHPLLSPFYSGLSTTLTERDIISREGGILRPDRLNFWGNTVDILDYKTGAALNSHRTQLNGYAHVLSEMGYIVGRKLLVYINQEVSVQSV